MDAFCPTNCCRKFRPRLIMLSALAWLVVCAAPVPAQYESAQYESAQCESPVPARKKASSGSTAIKFGRPIVTPKTEPLPSKTEPLSVQIGQQPGATPKQPGATPKSDLTPRSDPLANKIDALSVKLDKFGINQSAPEPPDLSPIMSKLDEMAKSKPDLSEVGDQDSVVRSQESGVRSDVSVVSGESQEVSDQKSGISVPGPSMDLVKALAGWTGLGLTGVIVAVAIAWAGLVVLRKMRSDAPTQSNPPAGVVPPPAPPPPPHVIEPPPATQPTTTSPPGTQATTTAPPASPVIQNTQTYVPYDTRLDSEAYRWAMDQLAKKYGASVVGTLETLESLKNQYLSGQRT